MDTTFWSRRRILTVAAAAVAATALPLTATARAFAATAGPAGVPTLPSLPDTPRARAVTAWLCGGRATRTAAAAALVGTGAGVAAFVATGLPPPLAEGNPARPRPPLSSARTRTSRRSSPRGCPPPSPRTTAPPSSVR
ncbi:hypothetical protein GCM10009665_74250 [Kitasatospora nipponensis]|uniref:Secreted protein n=1 Tax=Kitasatospora nipponensis TaxID=258049 RepID=A0ABN1T8S0_9ACTN